MVNNNYTSDERNAMRAYLQRGETRLSTMHRIAGVFLNGAGLLILIPFIFREGFIQIVNSIFMNMNEVSILILTLPLALSFFIPLLSLYELLRDIIYFYFSGSAPGFKLNPFIPRFSLSGLLFPSDEVDGNERLKKEIMKIQYTKKDGKLDLMKFILPWNYKERKYFEDMYVNTKTNIVPPTRNLKAMKILGNELKLDLENDDVQDFNIVLGLTGSLDKTLIEEVAKMEASLARHAFALRRLVLRYTKALIILIITALLFMGLVPFLVKLQNVQMTLSISLIILSIATYTLVDLPIRWIYKHFSQDIERHTIDSELLQFENKVKWYSLLIFITCALILILHIFKVFPINLV